MKQLHLWHDDRLVASHIADELNSDIRPTAPCDAPDDFAVLTLPIADDSEPTTGRAATSGPPTDQWARKCVADGEQKKEPYPPSHPWHYLHAGNNAPPIPVDQIEADPDAGRWLAERLPKNPKKRLQAMHKMLGSEQTSLAADKERYVDIIERGAEALSRYDREIAHTSDAMAVATALALKFNHISQGLGRVAWLCNQLGQAASPTCATY